MKSRFFASVFLALTLFGVSGIKCEESDFISDAKQARMYADTFFASKSSKHAFALTADIALFSILLNIMVNQGPSVKRMWSDGRYARLATFALSGLSMLILASDAAGQVGRIVDLAMQRKAALDIIEAESRKSQYMEDAGLNPDEKEGHVA